MNLYIRHDESICNDYKLGMSRSSISKKHHVGRIKLIEILARNGFIIETRRSGKIKFDKIDVDKIRKLYEDGNSIRKVAIKSGISERQIGRILKSQNIEVRRYYRPKKESRTTKFETLRDEVLKLYNKGFTRHRIAMILNDKGHKVSRHFPRYVLRKLGITEHRKLDDDTINRIYEMYDGGIRSPKISKIIGIDKSTVLRYLSLANKTKKYHTPKKKKHKFEEILRSKMSTANKTGREITINTEYLLDLYIKQNGKCSLTGVEMSNITHRLDTISIDRIDNNKGYVKGNVRLTIKFANLGKQRHSDSEFNDIIKRIKAKQQKWKN